jgi:nitroreductase
MTNSPIDLLLSRHSVAVRRLGGPGPDALQTDQILRAALTAPDHAALRPWRIVVIGRDVREELASLFVAAKRKHQVELGEAEIGRERDKALRPPLLVAMVARPTRLHVTVTEAEQLACAGAAMQNMLLAAHFLGFGAIILSGARCLDPEIRGALGITPDEHFLGFISVGSIVDAPLKSRRPDLAEMVTHLDRMMR